jgi:hypothetical protein
MSDEVRDAIRFRDFKEHHGVEDGGEDLFYLLPCLIQEMKISAILGLPSRCKMNDKRDLSIAMIAMGGEKASRTVFGDEEGAEPMDLEPSDLLEEADHFGRGHKGPKPKLHGAVLAGDGVESSIEVISKLVLTKGILSEGDPLGMEAGVPRGHGLLHAIPTDTGGTVPEAGKKAREEGVEGGGVGRIKDFGNDDLLFTLKGLTVAYKGDIVYL